MYAIIEDSGRQFKVHENQTLDVDVRDLPEGTQKVEFDKVLLIGDPAQAGSTRIGQPWVSGAKVIARIEGQIKGDKLHAVKVSRRKGLYNKKGHRQQYLRVTIETIKA